MNYYFKYTLQFSLKVHAKLSKTAPNFNKLERLILVKSIQTHYTNHLSLIETWFNTISYPFKSFIKSTAFSCTSHLNSCELFFLFSLSLSICIMCTFSFGMLPRVFLLLTLKSDGRSCTCRLLYFLFREKRRWCHLCSFLYLYTFARWGTVLWIN